MTDRDWPALCRRIAEALEPEPKWPSEGSPLFGMIEERSELGLWFYDSDADPMVSFCWFNEDPIAALALVEAFGKQRQHMWEVYPPINNGNQWLVAIRRSGILNEIEVLADSFCEAICLAVARALGVEE